jgi:hypothetical protein
MKRVGTQNKASLALKIFSTQNNNNNYLQTYNHWVIKNAKLHVHLVCRMVEAFA